MYTRVLSGHGVILNHYFGICLSTIFHWGYSHASWIIYTVSESNNSSLFAPVLSWRSWSCPDSVTTPDNRKQGKKAQRTETAKSPHCSTAPRSKFPLISFSWASAIVDPREILYIYACLGILCCSFCCRSHLVWQMTEPGSWKDRPKLAIGESSQLHLPVSRKTLLT